MSKPIVQYRGVPAFEQWPTNKLLTVAYLDSVVGHPTLGNAFDVRTSAVVRPIDEGGVFETRNTIYIPIGDSNE